VAWFRVDDAFHNHTKVRDAGNAAIGLWVRGGSYSSGYGLDGFVPETIATDYGRARERHRLTEVGLWIPATGGYVMPDFLEYNPSKAEVDARKAADAERKREARARANSGHNGHRRHAANGQFVPRLVEDIEPW
jgi:hypothetical protein